MRRIREVLRLRDELGASQRQIALACRLPRRTVRDHLRRLQTAGLTCAAVVGWSDDDLEARLFAAPKAATLRPEPDWSEVARDLGRRGVTLQLLWQEYVERHPDGYRYTQFVTRFRAWQAAHEAPRLRREHRPGDLIEIDYAGMTLSVGLGLLAKPAQVFVACLAYSGYLWADVTWTQQAEDWLGSHIRLVEHLGGVPARLVPDNLKVGVSHASFYDPAINPAYHDLARHYGTAVIPTRVRRPRDKPSVENGVQQVERRVLAPLRNRQFATLDEARAAVAERVRTVNGAPLSGQPGTTRQGLFAACEKPALKPLPTDRFVPGAWARYKLAPDYHVTVDGVAYSLPYRLIGKTIDVHSTATVISLFHRGRRVACHRRVSPSDDPRSGRDRVTLDAHRPANHRALDRYTADHIRSELDAIGAAAGLLFERILADADHPLQAVRGGRGLLRLAAAHGAGQLDQACQAALEANVGSYRYVKRWIATADIPRPAAAGLGDHANLRGASYYH
jgi:transposase